MHLVRSGSAAQRVVAGFAVQVVVPILTVEHVIRGVAVQRVIAGRGLLHQRLDRSHIPARAVLEADLIDCVRAGGVLIEIRLHRELVGRAVDRHDQVVARAAQTHIRGQQAACQQNDIDIIGRRRIVAHRVLTVTATKQIGIRTGFTKQIVISGTADNNVVAIPTEDIIHTFATNEQISPRLSIQIVVSCRPEKRTVI